MRRILAVMLPALVLAACAEGYDKTAVPGATAAMLQTSDRCKTLRATKALNSYSELETCELAATRTFFTSINLKRMDEFETYAASRLALAADLDAGRVTATQARFREAVIFNEFWAHCMCKPKLMRFSSPYFNDRRPVPTRNILGHPP